MILIINNSIRLKICILNTQKKNLNDVSMRLNANKKKQGIENQNYMTRMHDNIVNKIAECNLVHDIINPHKRTKI